MIIISIEVKFSTVAQPTKDSNDRQKQPLDLDLNEITMLYQYMYCQVELISTDEGFHQTNIISIPVVELYILADISVSFGFCLCNLQ